MEWLKQFARLFGWKNQQFEVLTEVNESGLKIRVWRAHGTLEAALASRSHDFNLVSEIVDRTISHGEASLYKALMAVDGVACVAIVNPLGTGVSAYPDWH